MFPYRCPLALALSLGLATPFAAHAQPESAIFSEQQFEALDLDNNGRIDVAEYSQFMIQAFGKIDRDGNGLLTREELGGVVTAEQFNAMDRDDSATISRDEFMEQVMSDFREGDKNNDGFVSR